MEPDDELDSLQATDPVESRELWDKRPDETAKAFGAFVLYRDAERRSFKIVGDQLNCSPQNIYQWSSRFDWRGRCDAYDIEQDRIQRADLARSRVRMRDRHLQVARAMLNVAAYGLKEWQLESLPHFDRGGFLRGGLPDAFGAVDMACQAARKKISIHRGAAETVVLFTASFGCGWCFRAVIAPAGVVRLPAFRLPSSFCIEYLCLVVLFL